MAVGFESVDPVALARKRGTSLEPLREDAEKTDEELKSAYSAFTLDARLHGIRAARVNLKLCGGF